MRKTALAAAIFALAAAGCANPLGSDVPSCDEVTAPIVISDQAVPGTEYIPCIRSLKSDWEYGTLQARSGRAAFQLSSLALGLPFLEVALLPSCDVSGAERVVSDEIGIPRYTDVHLNDRLHITIVPDTATLELAAYAAAIYTALNGLEIEDRTVDVDIDRTRAPVTDRIEVARAAGSAVILVTMRDAEQLTGTLLLPGRAEEIDDVTYEEALDHLEDAATPASYRGQWFYPFENGCAVYTFTASGSGVATLEEDIQDAIGLLDAEALRDQFADSGYYLP